MGERRPLPARSAEWTRWRRLRSLKPLRLVPREQSSSGPNKDEIESEVEIGALLSFAGSRWHLDADAIGGRGSGDDGETDVESRLRAGLDLGPWVRAGSMGSVGCAPLVPATCRSSPSRAARIHGVVGAASAHAELFSAPGRSVSARARGMPGAAAAAADFLAADSGATERASDAGQAELAASACNPRLLQLL